MAIDKTKRSATFKKLHAPQHTNENRVTKYFKLVTLTKKTIERQDQNILSL